MGADPRRLPPFVARTKLNSGAIRYRGWAMVDGRRKYLKLRTTPEQAYDDARRIRKLAEEIPIQQPTLGDAMNLVREHCRVKRTEGTLVWYNAQFSAIVKVLTEDAGLLEFSTADVEELIRIRLQEVKPATVRHNLRALGRCFELAMRRGWCAQNPVKMVELPRADEAKIDWFTAGELTVLLGQVDETEARDLFTLFAYTGIRKSEALRLQIGDVSLTQGELWIHGKRRRRALPISPDLCEPLERMIARAKLQNTERLIAGGEPEFRQAFRRWKARLKEPRLHAHALRHTFATTLIQSGQRLDVVQHLLGHRSLAMVMRYVHQHGPEARRAVAHLRYMPSSSESERDAQGS